MESENYKNIKKLIYTIVIESSSGVYEPADNTIIKTIIISINL